LQVEVDRGKGGNKFVFFFSFLFFSLFSLERYATTSAIISLAGICCTNCMRTCPRGAIGIVPYSFPILQREEEKDLDEIKVQLKGIGSQLGEMERSIKEL